MKTNKIFFSPLDLKESIDHILLQIKSKYDLRDIRMIIAPVRGGLVPSVFLSHQIEKEVDQKIPIISVILEDFSSIEHMNERVRSSEGGIVLVVDDINDSGKTFKRILNILGNANQTRCGLPCQILSTSMIENTRSSIKTNFPGKTREMQEKDWIDFFWEAEGV